MTLVDAHTCRWVLWIYQTPETWWRTDWCWETSLIRIGMRWGWLGLCYRNFRLAGRGGLISTSYDHDLWGTQFQSFREQKHRDAIILNIFLNPADLASKYQISVKALRSVPSNWDTHPLVNVYWSEYTGRAEITNSHPVDSSVGTSPTPKQL